MTLRRVRPRGRSILAVIVGFMCLLLAGCTAVTTLIDTTQALRDAGYQSVSVGFHVGSGDEVDVSVKVAAPATEAATRDVARIVWAKFHERFQWLHVTVNGSGSSRVFRVYAYRDLVSLFGPRNPAWDRTTLTSATTRFGALVIGVIALVAVVVVVVAVVATRRRRRGRGGGQPGYPGGPYPGGQGGRWEPGAGWRPAAGGGWAPTPLWPPPQGPPPEGPPPQGPAPQGPAPQGPPPAQPPAGWGSPPESHEPGRE